MVGFRADGRISDGTLMSENPTKPTAAVERLAYNTRELATAIGISPVSIWRLRQRGLLNPIPGLRHKLFSRAEVDRFLRGTATP